MSVDPANILTMDTRGHGRSPVPAVGDNRLRHKSLQRASCLANDSVTVAVEIPIWLCGQTTLTHLKLNTAFPLLPEEHEPRVVTGHIDFLQVRNGAVHILDYKPDARTNKPIAQLTLYALALTRLVGLSCSTSNVRGSTRNNIASSSHMRFSLMPGREVEARPATKTTLLV